jgi:membrane protein
MATAKIVVAKDLLLGAVLSSVAWQILASVAGVLIARDLKNAQAIAGFFGVILGLLAWFGLQAAVTVYAMEVDVVRARHLWPRSITQPPLTEADKRYIEDATRSEVRRPEQKVTIEFTSEADRDPLKQ